MTQHIYARRRSEFERELGTAVQGGMVVAGKRIALLTTRCVKHAYELCVRVGGVIVKPTWRGPLLQIQRQWLHVKVALSFNDLVCQTC